MNEDYIKIIEHTKTSVLAGVYYTHFNIDGLNEFMIKVSAYKDLPLAAKKASNDLKTLADKIEEIRKKYPSLDISKIKKEIFLINNSTEVIDNSLQFPKPPKSKPTNLVIIKNQKRPNKDNEYYKTIYFQKDSTRVLPKEVFGQLLVVIEKEGVPYFSFTKEKIPGVTYAFNPAESGAVTTNFNTKVQEKVQEGYYLIDDEETFTNEANQKFYRLKKQNDI
jgi:hypothetical protein